MPTGTHHREIANHGRYTVMAGPGRHRYTVMAAPGRHRYTVMAVPRLDRGIDPAISRGTVLVEMVGSGPAMTGR
jgi:hypothetical protein